MNNAGKEYLDELLSGFSVAVSTADARRSKELPEGKTGDERSATDAGCEEDEFFGNDLHSNSCCGEDEGGGTSSSVSLCRFYRHGQSPRVGIGRKGPRQPLLIVSRS